VDYVAFSSDNKYLASGSFDFRLFNTSNADTIVLYDEQFGVCF
jgi:hypothetical protein